MLYSANVMRSSVVRGWSLVSLLTVPVVPLAQSNPVLQGMIVSTPATPSQQLIQTAQPALRFDPTLQQLEQSTPPRFEIGTAAQLEQLQRRRVITPQERDLKESRGASGPVNVPAFQKACREGALTKKECLSGVATRPGSRLRRPRVEFKGQRATDRVGRRLAAPRTTPLTVPVSALLGDGSSFSLESVFAVTPRPRPRPGNGDRRLLFPVVGEAFTSSGFGWRLHPVLGSWLMHAGRDFAAPQGAPVLASLSGRVISSGLAGGYGITVVLEHQNPRRRTLYGHLSEIYVQPGQRIRQGEVIGRVGSTGLSTGPHLHFELRRPDGQRWIATDPKDLDLGRLMEDIAEEGDSAVSLLMAQLLRSLERPRETTKPSPPAG